jgi:hypothetical protein
MKIQTITTSTRNNQYFLTNVCKKNNISFKSSDDEEYVKIPKKKYKRDKTIEWGIIMLLLIIEAIRAFKSSGKPPKL